MSPACAGSNPGMRAVVMRKVGTSSGTGTVGFPHPATARTQSTPAEIESKTLPRPVECLKSRIPAQQMRGDAEFRMGFTRLP